MNDDDRKALELGCCKPGSEKAAECFLCAPRFLAIARIAAVLEAADRLRAEVYERHEGGWCNAGCGAGDGEPHAEGCVFLAYDRARSGRA